jgi:hypothetical protein
MFQVQIQFKDMMGVEVLIVPQIGQLEEAAVLPQLALLVLLVVVVLVELELHLIYLVLQ